VVAQALALRFGAVGHDMMLNNARGPETLADVVASLPGSICARTVAQAELHEDALDVRLHRRLLDDERGDLAVRETARAAMRRAPAAVTNGFPSGDTG
jgi:hypothetical protein